MTGLSRPEAATRMRTSHRQQRLKKRRWRPLPTKPDSRPARPPTKVFFLADEEIFMRPGRSSVRRSSSIRNFLPRIGLRAGNRRASRSAAPGVIDARPPSVRGQAVDRIDWLSGATENSQRCSANGRSATGPGFAVANMTKIGWSAGAGIWRQQIDAFSKTHRVIAIDPRSQGESTKTTTGNTPKTRAQAR